MEVQFAAEWERDLDLGIGVVVLLLICQVHQPLIQQKIIKCVNVILEIIKISSSQHTYWISVVAPLWHLLIDDL